MATTPETRLRAKDLRASMTPPEMRLWMRLKTRQPGQPVFRRQHPIGPFILDFYCAQAKLCIEIDGWAHKVGDPTHDQRRTGWLNERGIRVVRYTASDVLRSPDEISAAIVRTAQAMIAKEV